MDSVFLFSSSVFIFHYIRNMKKKKVSKIQDPLSLFLTTRKNQFTSFCKTEEPNKNISEELYDSNIYQTMLANETNHEKEWKRRQMFDYTPLGNIFMYYDIYKHVFVYASDQHMTYPILNACAMKYCKLFYCKDFFRDVEYIPNRELSPFTKMDVDELEKEKKKMAAKKERNGIDFKNAPFVVPKKTLKKSNTEPEVYKNLFRNIGKIQNVTWLQPVPPKKEKVSSYSLFKNKSKSESNIFRAFTPFRRENAQSISDIYEKWCNEDMNIVKYA